MKNLFQIIKSILGLSKPEQRTDYRKVIPSPDDEIDPQSILNQVKTRGIIASLENTEQILSEKLKLCRTEEEQNKVNADLNAVISKLAQVKYGVPNK